MYCECPEFKRCCVCFPLRIGVLVLGYFCILINALVILYNTLAYISFGENIIIFSMDANYDERTALIISVVLHSLDMLLNCILIYGVHQKIIKIIKFYFYSAIIMIFIIFVLRITEMALNEYFHILKAIVLFISFLVFQLYQIFLVRSLIKKLIISNLHSYDNQINQVVNGDLNLDNQTYAPTVVSTEDCV